ncbi:hypothetical protein B0T20DRAFT_391350 [Sordaria brevicollis]|uniref:Uncharacterized protein n=1 Tax=Sordaria brevicollis TaxID=83679 RepID=A0AAE0UD57_SORBR|nr:hypothetical protein B0T20DRAFT_391350 [Sordaria brevicollis]
MSWSFLGRGSSRRLLIMICSSETGSPPQVGLLIPGRAWAAWYGVGDPFARLVGVLPDDGLKFSRALKGLTRSLTVVHRRGRQTPLTVPTVLKSVTHQRRRSMSPPQLRTATTPVRRRRPWNFVFWHCQLAAFWGRQRSTVVPEQNNNNNNTSGDDSKVRDSEMLDDGGQA